jgi:Holliday junction resolvase
MNYFVRKANIWDPSHQAYKAINLIRCLRYFSDSEVLVLLGTYQILASKKYNLRDPQLIGEMTHLRRSRGYSYEHSLVLRLNGGSWVARRLGGSSTGLPDIVAVNNKEASLLSIEAKSGTGDALYVRPDQIQRCLLIKNMFEYYKTKHVILAFKFMRKKRFTRANQVVYEKRRLIEYYKIADKLNRFKTLPVVKCTYGGNTYVMHNGKFTIKGLPDYIMPFQRDKSERQPP